jgi:hypothetical protein
MANFVDPFCLGVREYQKVETRCFKEGTKVYARIAAKDQSIEKTSLCSTWFKNPCYSLARVCVE